MPEVFFQFWMIEYFGGRLIMTRWYTAGTMECIFDQKSLTHSIWTYSHQLTRKLKACKVNYCLVSTCTRNYFRSCYVWKWNKEHFGWRIGHSMSNWNSLTNKFGWSIWIIRSVKITKNCETYSTRFFKIWATWH